MGPRRKALADILSQCADEMDGCENCAGRDDIDGVSGCRRFFDDKFTSSAEISEQRLKMALRELAKFRARGRLI